MLSGVVFTNDSEVPPKVSEGEAKDSVVIKAVVRCDVDLDVGEVVGLDVGVFISMDVVDVRLDVDRALEAVCLQYFLHWDEQRSQLAMSPVQK